MKRGEFISIITKAFILLSAGALEGCQRLLNRSTGEESATEKEIMPLGEEKADSKSIEELPDGNGQYPDIVVVKGENPGNNVIKAIEKIGGMERFVKNGSKVVIKPNLLTAAAPEYAVTTNPLVVGAVVKLCIDAGASEVVVLDRSMGSISSVFEISGIEKATNEAGGKIKILTDRNFENTLIPEGKALKQWPLVKDIFEADVFINVPIAKHHSMAGLTMSMKNLMGIMGGLRALMHINFNQKIVDLNTLVKPHLVVLDAYRILLRNGPTGGNLSDVEEAKTVVVGTNQISVDAFGTTLFEKKPTDLEYLRIANSQGLGEIELNKLNIHNEELS